MVFLRVVEVFPPLYHSSAESRGAGSEGTVDDFVAGVRKIRRFADLVLVASVKKPGLVQYSPVEASLALDRRLGIDTAPVIVVRSSNRSEFISAVKVALSAGTKRLMLVWGDDSRVQRRLHRTGEYAGLSEAIREVGLVARDAGLTAEILAPVDLSRLGEKKGAGLARARLSAGADMLLAQPPTTDASDTFDLHAVALDAQKIRGVTMVGVFPFRSVDDVAACERDFGWRLPPAAHRLARSGALAVIEEARLVVSRLRDEGFPGVYVSTRGDPEVARSILS